VTLASKHNDSLVPKSHIQLLPSFQCIRQCTIFALETTLKSSLFCDFTQRKLYLVTDVSEQPICSILEGHAIFLDCLALEDGTGRLSRNVGNYQSTLHKIVKERNSHLDCRGSLKSRTETALVNKLKSVLPNENTVTSRQTNCYYSAPENWEAWNIWTC
jgi:hypothetical protein